MNIRPEQQNDLGEISRLITDAFRTAPHSSGGEAGIVDRLRASGNLSVSLVAEDARRIIGHIAFSPAEISDGSSGWYGLGPVAVSPSFQGRGVGAALIEHGLSVLRELGANGCVVLGEPAYYSRFGFTSAHDLVLRDVLAEYFQSISWNAAETARGFVAYSRAFDA